MMKRVLGYDLHVASVEDVVRSKVWGCGAFPRRSNRRKDPADIVRLVEAHPHPASLLPEGVRREIP